MQIRSKSIRFNSNWVHAKNLHITNCIASHLNKNIVPFLLNKFIHEFVCVYAFFVIPLVLLFGVLQTSVERIQIGLAIACAEVETTKRFKNIDPKCFDQMTSRCQRSYIRQSGSSTSFEYEIQLHLARFRLDLIFFCCCDLISQRAFE